MKRLSIQLYNAKTGESITLPLNPESISIPTEKDIKTYNILGYGEVPVRGNRQLKRINLTGLLPSEDTYFSLLASLVKQLEYRPYSMRETREMINRWAQNDDIIRVIISGELNQEFLIENSTPDIRENTEDTKYSIDLIEYRNPEVTTSLSETPKSNLQKLKERVINKYIPAQIIGKTGQTIYKLAILTYGGRWQELMDKNGITDPNKEIAGLIIEMLPL